LKPFASPFQHRPACSGPVDWKDWPAAQADIDLAKRALQGVPAEDIFMTSPSPSQIARYLKNHYYKNDEEYIFALADVMRRASSGIHPAARLSRSVDAAAHGLSRPAARGLSQD
jgi:5-methyltetrahydropteroyltriglutamate--homocysteine methyltransferase